MLLRMLIKSAWSKKQTASLGPTITWVFCIVGPIKQVQKNIWRYICVCSLFFREPFSEIPAWSFFCCFQRETLPHVARTATLVLVVYSTCPHSAATANWLLTHPCNKAVPPNVPESIWPLCITAELLRLVPSVLTFLRTECTSTARTGEKGPGRSCC